MTFFQSVLKGLQRSPRHHHRRRRNAGARRTDGRDVSCLVLPAGLPGPARRWRRWSRGIPVIEVEENANLMRNDLSASPGGGGSSTRAANYWEAAGVMAALKAGVNPASVRRPLAPVAVRKTGDYQRMSPKSPPPQGEG